MRDLQKNIRYIGTLFHIPLMNSMKLCFQLLPFKLLLYRIICTLFITILNVNVFSNSLKPAIPAATAGADTTICTDTYMLQANPVSIGETGTWTFPAGITISDINSPTALLSDLLDGNVYELIWTIDDGTEISKDTVYIHYQTTTPASAGVSVCRTLPYPETYLQVDLNGNIPGVSEIARWSVYGSPTATNDSILDPNTYQTSVKRLSAGNHILEYTITNSLSGCVQSDQLEIIVINQASINNNLTCFSLSGTDTTITLLGNASTAGELARWKLLSTGSTSVIQSPSMSNTLVSGISRGSHQFEYKIENNTCKDSSQITLRLTGKSQLPADTCIVINSIVNITATQPSSIEDGIWSANQGVFAINNDYNGVYSNYSVGSNTIYWTISDSSNNCKSVDSLVVTGISKAFAGNDTCIILGAGEENIGLLLNKITYNPVLESVSNYSVEGDSLVGFGQNIPIVLGTGKHSFISIITNLASGCQQKDTVVYTIISKAQAGPVQCLSEPISSIQLDAGNLKNGEIGEWKSTLVLDFDNITSTQASISNPPNGVIPLTWIISNGTCQDSSATTIAIISTANVANDTCVLADVAFNLQADAVDNSYQTGQWTIVQGGGILEDPLQNSTLYTASSKGVNELIWSVTDTAGTCSNTDTMTVVSISVPDAGSDQCISSNTEITSINLQGNEPYLNEAGYWVNADSISSILTNSANGIINLPIGRHTLIWNIKNINSSCVKSDTTVITILQKPNAGPNQCLIEPIASVQLNATNFSNVQQTGIWKSKTPLDLNNFSIPNATITNPPSGAFVITWVVGNAGCKDSAAVTIAIISKAVANQDMCTRLDSATQQFSINSTGINTLYQIGQWTGSSNNFQNGNPYIISDPLLNVTSVSNLNVGANKFYWTITDTSGYCSNKDSIVVTTVTKPVVMDDLCLSSNLPNTVVNLTANMFFPTIEKGYWTNKDSLSSKVGLTNNTTQQLSRGINNLYWTIENQQTGCKYSDSVSITIIPKSDAGEDLCIREGSTPIVLQANAPIPALGETGNWRNNPLINFANITDPQTSITPLASGVHILTWVIQNNGCIDTSNSIVSLISQPIAAGDICLTDNNGNNTTTLNSLSYNSDYQKGIWSSKSNTATIVHADSNNTLVKNLLIGSNTFYWKITDTISFCSLQDSLTITVLTKPLANSVTCNVAQSNQLGTVYLHGNNFNASIENGYWKNQSAVQFLDSTLISNTVVVNPGAYQFSWNIENKNNKTCSTSDTIEVVMLSKPLINELNKAPYCISGSSDPVQLNSDTAWNNAGEKGFWSFKNNQWNNISNTDSTNSQIEIKTENIGIHNLYWFVENAGCVARDSIELSIISRPNAGPDLCIPYDNGTQTLINLNAQSIDYSNEKGRWDILSGSSSFFTVTLQDKDSANTKASGLLKGIDKYKWTLSDKNGRCTTSDTVAFALITPPNAGPDLCRVINQGSTSVNISLKGNVAESTENTYWSSLQAITFGNPNATNTNVDLTQGHYKVLWNIRIPEFQTCQLSDTLKVTAISRAIAGENQCLATPAVNAILQGSSIKSTSGESGTWYNVTPNSSASIESPSDPNSKVSKLSTGVHRLKWVVNNSGCKDSSYTNLVLITKPNAGGNKCVPYTDDNTVVTLVANQATVADTANWVPSTNSLSGVSINPNNNINDVTVFSKGSYTIIYKIRDSANICPFFQDSARITLLTRPVLVPELCEKIPFGSSTKNISLQSGSNLISQETGVWTSNSAIIYDQPNGVNNNALNVAAGKYNFIWTIYNKTDTLCRLADTTVARVISQSYAGKDICLLKPVENTALQANIPLYSSGEQGTWKLLSTTGQIQFDPNNPKSTVIKLPNGISRFRWLIRNETCIDSSDVNVSVQTKSNAGPDFALCSDTAKILSNSFGVNETGTWHKKDPSIIIADSINWSTTVYNLKPGSNQLIWTIKNAICQNSDSINVTNNQPSFVNILTPDQETCFTANMLLGNKPTTEIKTAKSVWKLLYQPSNNSPKVIINVEDSDSTVVRNLNVAGNYIFTYNIYNSVCDTIRDTVTITRNESLYNYAVGPKTACVNDTIELEGQMIPSDGEGRWVLSGGYGTFENSYSNKTKVYDLATNQNLFYWRLKRGECENLQSVIVEGYPEPSQAKILSKNEQLCQKDSIFLEAIAPVFGQGKWSIQSGSALIHEPNNNFTKVTQLGTGRNIFKWTCTSGPCDSSIATVIFDRFEDATKANAGKDTLLCGNNLTLTANAPSSGQGNWTILQGSLNVVSPNSPTTQVTNIDYKENKLVWKIVNGTCISTDTITITAGEAVDQAKVQEDITVCGVNSIQISANNPKSGTGQWIQTSGASILNQNSNITTVQNLSIDTSYFEWVIKKGFCVTRDTLQIINFQQPDIANAGPDQNVYSQSVYLQAVKPVYGYGTWYTNNDLVEISDTNDHATMAANINKGVTEFVWTIKNGICPASSDTVVVYYNNFRVPNAFSPNGDGKNDKFEIKGLQEYEPASLIVFNRWNEDVYSSKNYQNDWDGTNHQGKELVDDTYFYILTLSNNEVYQGYIILKRK